MKLSILEVFNSGVILSPIAREQSLLQEELRASKCSVGDASSSSNQSMSTTIPPFLHYLYTSLEVRNHANLGRNFSCVLQ